jgi:RND family efflux transporter MFP subunit
MTDPAGKLEQLRIDRTATSPRRASRVLGWTALSAACLVVGAGLWLRADPTAPVVAAAATPPTQAAAESAVTPPASASVLDASGYVVARRQATLMSKITGRLVEVLVEEGQRIAAGQVIARLDNTNATAALAQAEALLARAEAELRAAEVALADTQPSAERAEEQFRRGLTSSEHVEAARSNFNSKRMAMLVTQQQVAVARAQVGVAKQNLEDTIIRAPFAGVVTVKAAEPGEMVSPSATGGFTRTGICTIVDMDSLEVEVDVSEAFISRVQPNRPVTVRLNAYPDWTIPAKVLAVIPTADRAKATVRVRVAFESRDPRIVPEMGARVSFREEVAAATMDESKRP